MQRDGLVGGGLGAPRVGVGLGYMCRGREAPAYRPRPVLPVSPAALRAYAAGGAGQGRKPCTREVWPPPKRSRES